MEASGVVAAQRRQPTLQLQDLDAVAATVILHRCGEGGIGTLVGSLDQLVRRAFVATICVSVVLIIASIISRTLSNFGSRMT